MIPDRSSPRVLCLSPGRAPAILLAAALLAVGLGGCGRRGLLEAPPDPSVRAAPADDSPQAGLRRPKRAPVTVPHDPFVLDPLL